MIDNVDLYSEELEVRRLRGRKSRERGTTDAVKREGKQLHVEVANLYT
jgi:hypothetical protein